MMHLTLRSLVPSICDASEFDQGSSLTMNNMEKKKEFIMEIRHDKAMKTVKLSILCNKDTFLDGII